LTTEDRKGKDRTDSKAVAGALPTMNANMDRDKLRVLIHIDKPLNNPSDKELLEEEAAETATAMFLCQLCQSHIGSWYFLVHAEHVPQNRFVEMLFICGPSQVETIRVPTTLSLYVPFLQQNCRPSGEILTSPEHGGRHTISQELKTPSVVITVRNSIASRSMPLSFPLSSHASWAL
jgi:hypothetical protein